MGDDWRLITVRQPWADAILEPDGKNVENRGQGFPKTFRGTLLIHSALTWSDRGQADPRVSDLFGLRTGRDWLAARSSGHYPPDRFGQGLILGLVDVDDIHPAHGGCCAPWGEQEYQRADGTWARQVTHLVLARPRRLARPIVYRGGLGLRHVPQTVIDTVNARLQEQTTP